MEPHIQYAETKDGVTVAYGTLREGWGTELKGVSGRQRVYEGPWQ